jgi:hypothetical protein
MHQQPLNYSCLNMHMFFLRTQNFSWIGSFCVKKMFLLFFNCLEDQIPSNSYFAAVQSQINIGLSDFKLLAVIGTV